MKLDKGNRLMTKLFAAASVGWMMALCTFAPKSGIPILTALATAAIFFGFGWLTEEEV